MTSRELVKREYHDGNVNGMDCTGCVPVYHLMRNEPDMFDSSDVTANYSVIAVYTNGSINQWFYDDIKQAFRIFRIMSVGRDM